MNDNELRDFEFTQAAWESLYDAVDATEFQHQDAQMIYDSLRHRLRFISFGDYLKRYIYIKAGLTEAFGDVDIKVYQQIIKSSFEDNCTPQSFTPTTAKLSALSKNWLTQQTVKRNVVFLLGFGLNMSVEDVNLFLTKALREHEINPKDPFEAICWYCYKNGYNYLKFESLWERYNSTPANSPYIPFGDGERTISIRSNMYSVSDDESKFIAHLSKLKTTGNLSMMSETARSCFNKLYDEAREIIAQIYNKTEEENHAQALAEYQQKLSRNDRLYDYEKLERIESFRQNRKVYKKEDITESDFEHIICAAIPTDRHGNLTPSKISKLNEQFAGRRFSRQRIGEILSGKSEINRFDLITLNFFIFSNKLRNYPKAVQRYTAFLESTNKILQSCFMGGLYIQNPYECFVLMCILSRDPLGTYADVWELSYEK